MRRPGDRRLAAGSDAAEGAGRTGAAAGPGSRRTDPVSALQGLQDVEELLRRAGERAGLTAALTVPVLKSLGLALLGRFSASLCRDAGQASAAQAVELASACAILCVSMPLLQSLLELVFAYT